MSRRWVVNASPLIVLAKARYVHLLRVLSEELIIPAEVAAEIRSGSVDDPARQWLESDGARHVQSGLPTSSVVAAWDLGAGETAVLSWTYQHRGLEAIVDDHAARQCAAALGIPVRGTLGVVLLAKRLGVLPVVRPVIDAVMAAGLHVTDELRNHVLQLANE